MRVECPGCKREFTPSGNEILTAREAVAVLCPSCSSVLKVGILETRAAVEPPGPPPRPEPAPVPAPDPARETAEPGEDAGIAPGLKSHILRSLVNLPAMPLVILKAREVMANPDAGLRDLSKIIENDQALVGKVLSIANSAYYGLSGQVATIGHASVLLGLRVLGDVILMSAASSLLNRELKGYGLDPRTAWRHSLAAALCARRIAEVRHPEMREDAFVIGLLHDAGKIILDPFLEKSREALAALCPKGEPVTPAVEKELLGFDHTEIMARACRFWRFPETVVQAVRYHHRPSQSSGHHLAHVAHLANVAAHRAGLGCPETEADSLQAEGTLDTLDFQEGDVAELAADALREVEKLESGLQTD